MPVYFFTFHAYRSWRLDRPEGYIQRGESGVRQPNEGLADYRESSASHPPVLFNKSQQLHLIAAAKDICIRRGWLLYAVSVVPTHMHILVGWKGKEDEARNRDRMKSLLGKALSDQLGTTGHRWLSRGGHTEQVLNERHLEELVTRYVPKHTVENGSVYIKLWGEEYEG